eukprot:m.18985 g.18985  ORF g.18985 m.18985 type:complete len:147 (+) comp27769_c0_seq1:999-1439(+)
MPFRTLIVRLALPQMTCVVDERTSFTNWKPPSLETTDSAMSLSLMHNGYQYLFLPHCFTYLWVRLVTVRLCLTFLVELLTLTFFVLQFFFIEGVNSSPDDIPGVSILLGFFDLEDFSSVFVLAFFPLFKGSEDTGFFPSLLRTFFC